MRLKGVIEIVLAALLAAACSVKEDRRDCPTWLTVDVSGCGDRAEVVSVRCFDNERRLFADTLRISTYTDSLLYVKEVTRGEVTLSYWNGVYNNALFSGSALMVPLGYQCDSLYAGRDEFIFYDDERTAKAHLEKQFMTLGIEFKDMSGEAYQVEARYSGFDIDSFTPVRGIFRAALEKGEDAIWRVRLIRQGDDSVITLRYSIPGTSFINMTLTLSESLKAISYDWNEKELRDATVTIYPSYFTVNVDGWDDVYLGDFNY